MKKETFKLVKMGYDARQYAAHVMEGKEFIHHGDTVYSFKHVPDYEEFCKFMGYGTTTFGEEMVFSNNHEWELVEDVKYLKLIQIYYADARFHARSVLEGKEFKSVGNNSYMFRHKSDFDEYLSFRGIEPCDEIYSLTFLTGAIWEEVTKSEIAVKPEKTTVKYGDVIHLKNIGVYHFIGVERDGGELSTAEEIVTDLDKIRLNLRPEALMKWAKFAHDTKMKFGKEIDWTL